MSNFAVILPAAGQSSRFKDKNYKKPFAPLANRPVWLHVVERFINRPDVKQTILAISPEDREYFDFKFAGNAAILGVEVVDGGADRATSVQNALARVRPDIDFVAIHDAARPCVADAWITSVFNAAEKHDAAILAIPVSGTLKRVTTDSNGKQIIAESVDRTALWEAQTPQVFRRTLLMEAFAKRDGFAATDEAQLVERIGVSVHIVPSSPINLKITTRDDLRLAEHALRAVPKPNLDNAMNPFSGDDMWR
ncbi:MAG: 2-C-methyl-D-erythritol 4-phosphate cytidylyltransferase [Planctomycetota bacterium]|nr:2-C-methyl-D-erythritol 4-phosphate cytidylyltransferase [Planctomycetota bacterium]